MNRASSRLVLQKFDEGLVRATAEELRAQLGAAPTLVLAFVSTDYLPHLTDFQEIVAVHGHAPAVVGCTGAGLIGTAQEAEGAQGFSLLFLHLPETKMDIVSITQAQLEAAQGDAYWQDVAGLASPDGTWLTLLNPFRFDGHAWMSEWDSAFRGAACVGGVASGPDGEEELAVFGPQIGQTTDALALRLHGGGHLGTVVAQGCRPIGEALPVTRSEDHLLLELGSRPAYQVLEQAYESLTNTEKQHARGNIFAGLALDEYKDSLGRGDFLVRNILGADPATGAVVLAALPRTGQTMQYQLRDAASAREDIHALLEPFAAARQKPVASLLFSCRGRGKYLFGEADHDAKAIAQKVGAVPSAGLFCNGEIGAVGGRNFIHGYTCSIGLIF